MDGGYGYISITNWQLAMSVLLVIMTGIISAAMRLGLLRSLLWGTIRAFIQLTLIGYILAYVFNLNTLAVIVPILIIMCLVASREAGLRVKSAGFNAGVLAFISLSCSTLVVGLIVVVLIIGPHPWYSARVVIPIFGMLLGNSMNAIALSLDRMISEIQSHADEVEQMLCFGATPWEALVSHIRKAVAAGMTPTINSLMVVGIVSLPGMMTGQILAGMNPQEAIRYQFVVMVMIAASVAIGCLIIVSLSYRQLFNEDMALQENMRRNL